MIWLLLFACAEPRNPEDVLVLSGDAKRGEAQYQIVCSRCHGAGGNGNSRTPGLNGRVHTHADKVVIDAMINGRGAMSRQTVSDQQSADILAYLRLKFPGK